MKKVDDSYPKPNGWWAFFFANNGFHKKSVLQTFARFITANEFIDFGKVEALERKYPHCLFIFKEFFGFTFTEIRKCGVDIDNEKQLLTYGGAQASLSKCFINSSESYHNYDSNGKKQKFSFISRDRLGDVSGLIDSFVALSLKANKKHFRFFEEIEEYLLSAFGGHKGVLGKTFYLDLGLDSYNKQSKKFQIFEFTKDHDKSKLYGKIQCKMSMSDRTYDIKNDKDYIQPGNKNSVFLRPTNVFKNFPEKLRQRYGYWRNPKYQELISQVVSRIAVMDNFTQLVEEIGSLTKNSRQAKIMWYKTKTQNQRKYPDTIQYETKKHVLVGSLLRNDSISSYRDGTTWTFFDFLDIFTKYSWSFCKLGDHLLTKPFLIKNP